MKGPPHDQNQARKVKPRSCMVQHTQNISQVRKIQTDSESSFKPQITLHFTELPTSRRRMPPGCSDVDGALEQNQNTDSVDLHRGRASRQKRDPARKQKSCQADSNEDRPRFALKRKTLADRVRELIHPSKTVKDPS